MERARRGRTGGRRAAIVGADRKTHHRGISERGLYPPGQHHDAGAGSGSAAIRGTSGDGDRAIAVTAPCRNGDAGARGGQKAGCAEAASGSAGSVDARGSRRTGACCE